MKEVDIALDEAEERSIVPKDAIIVAIIRKLYEKAAKDGTVDPSKLTGMMDEIINHPSNSNGGSREQLLAAHDSASAPEKARGGSASAAESQAPKDTSGGATMSDYIEAVVAEEERASVDERT